MIIHRDKVESLFATVVVGGAILALSAFIVGIPIYLLYFSYKCLIGN